MNHSADEISTARERDGRAAICRSRRADQTDAARDTETGGRALETREELERKENVKERERERETRGRKSPMNWRIL